MKKYESRLKVPIMMEQEKLKKIDEFLLKIITEIEKIEKRIKDNENQIEKNLEELINQKSNSSLFFGYTLNSIEEEGIKNDLILLKKERESTIKEKEEINRKIKKLVEVDTERKKEFEKQLLKNEEKKIEELKQLLKEKE